MKINKMLKMFSKLRLTTICDQKCLSFVTKRNVMSSVDVLTEPLMSCWQLKSYSKTFTDSTLTLNTECPKPVIQKPNQLLIEVISSSVNPIDLAMSLGYGNSLLSAVQLINDFGIDNITYDRLPLVLGRDFCGQVLSCGQSVTQYRAGDIVWGALPPFSKHGSYSEFIVANESDLSLKPSNISAEDCAAIPYVGLTAWAAIHTIGGLNEGNAMNKRALILGGSGGVGTFAIQLLKSWGAHVITTCASDAFDFVYDNTGADHCIDYETNELNGYLESFDYVLNATTYSTRKDNTPEWGVRYLSKWKGSVFVTLSPPLLGNTDRFGLIFGTGLSAIKAIEQTIRGVGDGQSVRWAFFRSNTSALKSIAKLVENNQIKAVIDNRFKFKDLSLAFESLSKGHSRGKTIIELK